jgi:hypothetical protein
VRGWHRIEKEARKGKRWMGGQLRKLHNGRVDFEDERIRCRRRETEARQISCILRRVRTTHNRSVAKENSRKRRAWLAQEVRLLAQVSSARL